MTKFPNAKETKRISKKLKNAMASHPLSPKASAVERAKHKLCSCFIVFKNENKLTQKEFADLLQIDEALISKILHYQVQSFTTDRLIRYLSLVYPHLDVELKVA